MSECCKLVVTEFCNFVRINDQPCLFRYRPPEVLKKTGHQQTPTSTSHVVPYLASVSTLAFFASNTSASRLISFTSWVSENPMVQYFGGIDGGAQLCLCLDISCLCLSISFSFFSSMFIGEASMTTLDFGEVGVRQRGAWRRGGNGPTVR